jgi:hypothetical protein
MEDKIYTFVFDKIPFEKKIVARADIDKALQSNSLDDLLS